MICDEAEEYRPLDISTVTYFDHGAGQMINYTGTPGVFLYKDRHFELDMELRIVYWPSMTEPTPDHILLPVSLKDLIDVVVLAPKSTLGDLREVWNALRKVGLDNIPVQYSRDDREFME